VTECDGETADTPPTAAGRGKLKVLKGALSVSLTRKYRYNE